MIHLAGFGVTAFRSKAAPPSKICNIRKTGSKFLDNSTLWLGQADIAGRTIILLTISCYFNTLDTIKENKSTLDILGLYSNQIIS